MSVTSLDKQVATPNWGICYDHFEHAIEISLKDFYKDFACSELAKWFYLDVDGESFLALVSCNYALSPNSLKKSFNAKKVVINQVSHDPIFTGANTDKVILDHNLMLGSKKIVFKSSNSNLYYKINRTELTEKIGAKVFDLGTYPIYKAKVSFVSPVAMREDYINLKYPFFGISMENTNFVRPKLLASLEWICNRYKKCAVLIGDSIHRITIQHNEEKDETYAQEKAILLGKKFLQDESHVFEKFNDRCEFNFIFCSEIQESIQYNLYHKFLKNLFISDNSFRNSIESFAKDYHEKRKYQITPEKWFNLIESSCEYFLEEFAIFACLKNLGMDGMIYPGSFSTLSEIAAGEHPNALQELKELVVVSLHIKKR